MRGQGSIWRWVHLIASFLVLGLSAYGQTDPGRSVAVSNMTDVLHRSGSFPDSSHNCQLTVASATTNSQLPVRNSPLTIHQGGPSNADSELTFSEFIHQLAIRNQTCPKRISLGREFGLTIRSRDDTLSVLSPQGADMNSRGRSPRSPNQSLLAEPCKGSMPLVHDAGSGTAVILNSQTAIDSLKLHLLNIDIARAELRLSETNVWHRLIPEVRISANVGVQQLVFIDPTTFTPYILPKDSYRLTLSLSLSNIFTMTEHDNAILSLESLKAQYLLLQTQQRLDRQLRDIKLASLATEQHLVEEELRLTNEILRYTQLLFDQGKTDFDNLTKAKLQVLNVKKALNSIQLKQYEQ